MIHTYLDLSTCHLTEETLMRLAASSLSYMQYPDKAVDADGPAFSIAAYPEGFFITVPDFDHVTAEQQGLLPQDLATVLHFAADRGCTLIRFDADGGTMTGLPTYEWEN